VPSGWRTAASSWNFGAAKLRRLTPGEATVDTRHGFTEYLERLLVSRGLWYWIQALSRETSDNPEAEAFRTAAPRLFSDFQESLFQPR